MVQPFTSSNFKNFPDFVLRSSSSLNGWTNLKPQLVNRLQIMPPGIASCNKFSEICSEGCDP